MTDEPLQKLTEKEFESWIPAATAHGRVLKFLFGHGASANAIAPRLMTGLIRAGAENHAYDRSSDPPGGVIEIESAKWRNVEDLDESYDFWRTGTLSVTFVMEAPLGNRGYKLITYFGVRFEPVGFEKLMASLRTSVDVAPVSSPPSPQYPSGSTWVDREYGSGFVGAEQSEDSPPAPPAKHAGGAPFKPFWDDLWAAMGGLVHKGTLNPGSKQKDIEEAMCQWASDNNHELSIPAARPRARKLLAALKKAEEDNN